MVFLLLLLALCSLDALWVGRQTLRAYVRLSFDRQGVRASVKATFGPFMLPEAAARLRFFAQPRLEWSLGRRTRCYRTIELRRTTSKGRRGRVKLDLRGLFAHLRGGASVSYLRATADVGFSDAAATAFAAGALWALFTPILGFAARNGADYSAQVRPDFRQSRLALSFACMFSLRAGHLMRAGAFLARQAITEAKNAWIIRLKTSCAQRWKALRT